MEFRKDLKLIIFDFDGTLHDLTLDWENARKALGIEHSTESIGSAIERLKQEGDTKRLKALDDLESQALSDDIIQKEIKETLQQLHTQYKIAIYSRNSRKAITDFVTKNGIQPDYIIGREDVEKLKPHPEGLQKILSYFECTFEQAVLVGDTWHDLFVAHEAGLSAIIVGDNYRHDTEEPEHRIKSISELTDLLI